MIAPIHAGVRRARLQQPRRGPRPSALVREVRATLSDSRRASATARSSTCATGRTRRKRSTCSCRRDARAARSCSSTAATGARSTRPIISFVAGPFVEQGYRGRGDQLRPVPRGHDRDDRRRMPARARLARARRRPHTAPRPTPIVVGGPFGRWPSRRDAVRDAGRKRSGSTAHPLRRCGVRCPACTTCGR